MRKYPLSATRRRGVFGRGFTMLALCAVLASAGCAPPFSELQSAHVTAPGEYEITGHYSQVHFDAEGLFGGEKMEAIQDHFGLQAEHGFGDQKAFRLRYERISLDQTTGTTEELGVNVIAAGVKFGINPDHVAFYLPIGCAWGSDVETSHSWQIHPTLLLSHRLHEFVELNGSAKGLIPLNCDGCETTYALNLGLGIGNDRFTVRPEVGLMADPGEDYYYKHFSLGFSLHGALE